MLSAGAWEQVTPESAGWRYLHFGVRQGSFSAETGEVEVVLVPLKGRCRVEADGQRWEIGGRQSVFDGMPWAVYLPRDTAYRVEADQLLELAVCGARCHARREPALVRPEDIEIEVRGAGNATRQINHIIKPEFPADQLLLVEVYTPSGNWSSYPPHKHDVHNPPGEVDLDEIYFYKISAPEGYAIQKIYTRDGRRDETLTVRDNEAVLIPEGYHPVVAAHGYDCYYLNVLAGSARSMAASDDPDYAWVRGKWNSKDQRLPLVS